MEIQNDSLLIGLFYRLNNNRLLKHLNGQNNYLYHIKFYNGIPNSVLNFSVYLLHVCLNIITRQKAIKYILIFGSRTLTTKNNLKMKPLSQTSILYLILHASVILILGLKLFRRVLTSELYLETQIIIYERVLEYVTI